MIIDAFLLGLDFIIDKAGKIKILEIQNMYLSDIQSTPLTKKHPMCWLKSEISKLYPAYTFDETLVSWATNYKKRTKQTGLGKKVILMNRGLEALLEHKWLFYLTCMAHTSLTKYIPRTKITTLNTLDSTINLEELANKRFLFKPSSRAKGEGIALLPQCFSTHQDLRDHLSVLLKNISKPNEQEAKEQSGEDIAWNTSFVLQEYLYEGPAPKPQSMPVVRVYAGVVWNGNAAAQKLDIIISKDAVYQYTRKNQDKNDDFTLGNNQASPLQMKKEIKKIETFLEDFFNTLIAKQNKIHHCCWENLVKKYIKEHRTLSDNLRLNILCQFAQTLATEQCYSQNRLSHYQCFLLKRFIECYMNKDEPIYRNRGLTKLLWEAFQIVGSNNLDPYADQIKYPLHDVFRLFLEKIVLSSKELLGIHQVRLLGSSALIKIPKTTERDYLDAFTKRVLNYLTHEDLEAMVATSMGYRESVERYARDVNFR